VREKNLPCGVMRWVGSDLVSMDVGVLSMRG
jgi:hypothetical protein